VAAALGYAHARGVIHRDVTSRNIMLSKSGATYVLDFGLARVPGRTESSSGHVAGTAPYLAPETLRGQGSDARSDIYSLGVVLYESLAGTRPFHGESIEVLQYECLNALIDPPSRLRPEVGEEIDALVMRMLSRDPAERHTNADELASDLMRQHAALANPVHGGAVAESIQSTSMPELTTGGAAGPSTDGVLVDRIVSGRARAYLAVLPIEAPGIEDPDGERRRLLDQIAEAARAGLAHLERVHVVGVDVSPDTDELLRVFARRVGANLVLRSTARLSGTAVRITFALVDPEQGQQVAGGTVDGSLLQPFELEDRLIAAVRESLGFPATADDSGWRARPRDPAAQERFALALAYLKRFDQEASIDGAITLLEGLLATEGESAAVHAALARACLHKYRHNRQRVWETRAEQSCDRAMKIDPYAPEVLLAMGELHTTAGRFSEALVELDHALALRPDFYEAHLGRARALDGAGRATEAEESCRRAIAHRPGDWRGYHTLALVLFRHGRYAEALGPWRRVAKLTPDNAGAQRNLGSALYHLDRYNEAVTAFRRANDIRPDVLAFFNLGTVLFRLERFEECVIEMKKAAALAPSDPRTWGNLGNACRHIPGHEAQMKEALERATGLMRERLDRDPGEGEDWARLAGWLACLGKRDEAEQAIRHALEISPDDVHCMVMAGHTLLELGSKAEALGWLKRAVESGYGVDSLRRDPELRALAGDTEFERVLEHGSGSQGAEPSTPTHEERPS